MKKYFYILLFCTLLSVSSGAQAQNNESHYYAYAYQTPQSTAYYSPVITPDSTTTPDMLQTSWHQQLSEQGINISDYTTGVAGPFPTQDVAIADKKSWIARYQLVVNELTLEH